VIYIVFETFQKPEADDMTFPNIPFKTIGGAIVAAVGYLSSPDVFAVLPKKVAAVVTVLGIILSAVGARHAVKKVETKVDDLTTAAETGQFPTPK
jgi:hypothetical protein